MAYLRERLRARLADQRTYYWIFLAVLLVPHLFLCYTEPIGVWAKLAMILVPGAVYMAFMSVFRKPGVPLWILFPMLVFGAFQLVLLYLFGNSIIAVDMFLNVVTTNPNEAMELLGKLMPSIVGVIALYVPALVLAVLSIRHKEVLSRRFRRRSFVAAGLALLLGVGTLGLAYGRDKEYRVRYDLWPANIFYNIHMARDIWQKQTRYHETSQGFTFGAVSEHPDSVREVYMLVIGETSRASSWQLYGYERETNPNLMQEPNLILLRDLITQSNTTHKSVPIMLSNASAENHDVIYQQKSLITAFKEAGFYTAFYSNQLRNRSFIDFFGDEADETVFLKASEMAKEEGYSPYDTELLLLVDQLLTRDHPKLLIVLHTYGSHFNYQERYDARDAYFSPDNVEGIRRREREKLINAYDNSLRYTDALLHGLIQRLRGLDAASALFYSPDHGEDLLDDRRNLFLHASPIPSYYQIHIPGVLWLSPQYDTLWPGIRYEAEQHHAKPMTTNSIFHTMLTLGGIDTPYRNDSLSVLSPGFTVVPRYYLNDHNRPVAIERLGMKPLDVKMFREQGLDFPEVPRRRGKSE